METLSIESAKPFDLEILRAELARHWRIERSAGDTLVVHGQGTRAYVYVDTQDAACAMNRLCVNYSDINLAKALVERLADDAGVTVDNDFGTILAGNEFVAKCKNDRAWDWRRCKNRHP